MKEHRPPILERDEKILFVGKFSLYARISNLFLVLFFTFMTVSFLIKDESSITVKFGIVISLGFLTLILLVRFISYITSKLIISNQRIFIYGFLQNVFTRLCWFFENPSFIQKNKRWIIFDMERVQQFKVSREFGYWTYYFYFTNDKDYREYVRFKLLEDYLTPKKILTSHYEFTSEKLDLSLSKTSPENVLFSRKMQEVK